MQEQQLKNAYNFGASCADAGLEVGFAISNLDGELRKAAMEGWEAAAVANIGAAAENVAILKAKYWADLAVLARKCRREVRHAA